MKNLNKMSKFKLSTETLRALGAPRLAQVQGGSDWSGRGMCADHATVECHGGRPWWEWARTIL